MVWLNFATAISITTLLFLFFELSLGSIEGTFILFLVSIFASISFGCWTSKNALRKFRLIFCKYVDHGENQNTSIE
jgi:hypothetical protein